MALPAGYNAGSCSIGGDARLYDSRCAKKYFCQVATTPGLVRCEQYSIGGRVPLVRFTMSENIVASWQRRGGACSVVGNTHWGRVPSVRFTNATKSIVTSWQLRSALARNGHSTLFGCHAQQCENISLPPGNDPGPLFGFGQCQPAGVRLLIAKLTIKKYCCELATAHGGPLHGYKKRNVALFPREAHQRETYRCQLATIYEGFRLLATPTVGARSHD
jgi:hypothetical protein